MPAHEDFEGRVVATLDLPDEPGTERHEEERAVADPAAEDPERAAMRAQMRRLLERKIDELPLVFRMAFILREVEE